jgi:hypothetical protein
VTAVNPQDSRLHYRAPAYHTERYADRDYRVPEDCRIIGTLHLGPDVTLAALQRHRESTGKSLWVDSLVLRIYCCGRERVWYDTRSSVSVPLGYAPALAKLIEQVAAADRGKDAG